MKKILMTLAVALGFAAIANADFISGTSFERYLNGVSSAPLNTEKDDLGGNTDSYWILGETDSIVTNDASIATDYTGERPAVQSEESAQNNYLIVDASTTLGRLVNTDKSGESIGNGLYFDSLVKFTVADAPDLTPETGDKLVVWMQAVEGVEVADNPDTTDIDESEQSTPGSTNLVVTAGYLSADNTPSAKTYVVATDPAVLPDTWHRLTIKAISDIGTDKDIVGFVVFIDGKPVTNTEAKGATGSVMDSLNATAGVWAEKNALFPSLIKFHADNADTIASVGFKGSGAVDDLVFTTTAPSFAADGTYFTLNWTPAAYASLKVDGDDVEDITKGTQNFAFEGSKAFTVAYTLNSGWSMKAPTFDGTATAGDNSYLFSVTAACSATLNTAQALFQVGTDVFGTFAEALNAAGDGAIVKVLANITMSKEADALTVEEGANIVIDLAGHVIDAGTNKDPAIYNNFGATLRIIDSVGGGKVKGDSCKDGIIGNDGVLIIGAAEGDQLASFDGYVYGGECIDEGNSFSIIAGKFKGDTFEYGEYLAVGSTVSPVAIDGYWVVTPGDAPVTHYVQTYTNGVEYLQVQYSAGAQTITLTDPVYDTETEDWDGKWYAAAEDNTEFVFDGSVAANTQVAYARITPKVIPPTTYTVTFSTNEFEVVEATTTVSPGQMLESDQIPKFDEEGTWDVDPLLAVISCDTNFNYTITAPVEEITLSWIENEAKMEATVYINEISIENGAEVTTGDEAEFVVLPKSGYEYATAPEDGWSTTTEGGITKSITVENESIVVTIPEPTVKTYTITYEGATVTNGVTQYTIETETFALPTAADIEERSGGQFVGWTNAVSEVKVTEVTKGTDGDLTFYAVWESAGEFYPDYINPENADLKRKFNDWVTNVNGGDRDTTSANLEAYLLNCTPDQVETEKAKFKITSITKVGEIWEVKVGDQGQNGEYGNGYINIISVRATKFPTAGNAADFFQATLVIQPVYKDE